MAARGAHEAREIVDGLGRREPREGEPGAGEVLELEADEGEVELAEPQLADQPVARRHRLDRPLEAPRDEVPHQLELGGNVDGREGELGVHAWGTRSGAAHSEPAALTRITENRPAVGPDANLKVVPSAPMDTSTVEVVLEHSGELQQARSLADLLRVSRAAVASLTRYRALWIAWFDPLHEDMVRIIAGSPEIEELLWETAPLVPIAADAMIEEIGRGRRPVVVEDARIDPRTNKDMVARFGNRTIINIPVFLSGTIRGAIATGTFGDEGVRPPTQQEIDALVIYASQFAPAFDRVRMLEEREHLERKQLALQQQLESLQRVELMGVLAAGVAHDINNLLAVAFTSLDSVERARLGSDAEALDDATNALGKVRDLSRQLLQLGRQSKEKRQRVPLIERVSSTLELVRPSIPRSVKVSYRHQGEPVVEGDPLQLEQAVANLVINARDAVGLTGNISLSVDERTLDASSAAAVQGGRAGRFARFAISDSGPGIPTELLGRVFDPLFTTKPQGTGLGLAVVTHITRQHQGFVAVRSPPGEGATFELYLPVVDEGGVALTKTT